MSDVSNTDDIIDSQDVIARHEELHDELRAEFDELIEESKIDDCTDFDAWVRGAFEDEEHPQYDEVLEYLQLDDLIEEAEGYGDWSHGATLIRWSYFQDYAEELASDIGAINRGASWPLNCIDWEQAANELRVDYTEVDFGGVTYLMRA